MRFKLEIVRHTRIWLAISGFLAVIAAVSLATRGLNYGIDFTGGIIMDLKFEKPATTGQVRAVLADHGFGDAVIREATGTGGREFLITTRQSGEAARRALFDDLKKRVGAFEQRSLDVVTPVIGTELKRNALLGVFLATAGILVYITFRFEWRFGLAAVVALLHDVFLTVGFFSLFRLPVDTSFVAAILTVFGYSINDTIIVFDRIRENLRYRRRESLAQLVDHSINQVLTRSINTAMTTIMAVGAIYVFGGRTVKDLALALVVGIAFGAYSSIFVASPVWVLISERLGRSREGRSRPRAANA